MDVADRPGPDPQVDVGRVRLAGWSPGTSTLLGAWIASAAIARLTGATAVIMLLAAAMVAVVFEIVGGWQAVRAVRVRSVTTPPVVTVGDTCHIVVDLDSPRTVRSIDRRRVTLRSTSGAPITADPDGGPGIDVGGTVEHGPNGASLAARFPAAGVVTRLSVQVELTGPAGLVWWRRSTDLAIEPLHVAPVARGPAVDVESNTAATDGCTETRRGNHGGEIDGVRPWRHGDSTSSVHWPSSLRTDELIVHDRLAAADERRTIDLVTWEADADRVRWTIGEAHRHGHTVAVRTADGTTHTVADHDAAARWSAVVAHAHGLTDDDGHRAGGLLRREIPLRIPAVETVTSITGLARWSAAAAAFASMAMLVGALHGSVERSALVAGAVVGGAVASLWVARRSGRRPLPMQVAIGAASLLALAMIVAQAAEVDGLLTALRGPLPNVLLLLVALHGFETIDRRTLRVHLAITFVLASYAAGLRIDGALGWWLAAWAVPFVVSMLATARRHRPATARPDASQRPGVASAGTIGRWATSFVALGAATLAVLSLVPVPDGPARLGLPALSVDAPAVASPGGLALPDGSSPPVGNGADASNPDRGTIGNVVGYPGFTETLDTSVRGDLGEQIVMRVRAPEPAFWRGQTFTEFDGRVWRVSPEVGQSRTGPMIDVRPTVGDALGSTVPTSELVQTYFVEQDLPNIVFAAYRADQVIFDGSLWTRPDGALRSDVTLTSGSVYTVISQRPQVNAEILRAQGDLGEFFEGFSRMAGDDEIAPFLELPESTTRRTIDLAARLRTPGESTYDTILAYEAWLGANTEYDLDAPVPPDGADAVDDFLFESQLGYCEQIASTLTIMLRSQGVPARLATGYVPGERDRVSGVWNVRNSDAHAWVEVWFPQTGWQAFDPTAEVPLAADAGNATVGGDLIGATASSVVSHRGEIALAALVAAAVWGLLRLVTLARYRRRRGRWGVLQDRYTALVDHLATGRTDTSIATTNTAIAAAVDDSSRATAREVADELDRAAFDPSWMDDDERFRRARSALDTLERSKR